MAKYFPRDFDDMYNDMDLDDAQTIADMVSRENLFIKRYFGTLELAASRGLVDE